MATIDIKLSQKTVDQLRRIDSGESANLSNLFGTIVEANYNLSEASSWANSWSSSGNKVSLRLGGGATLTYIGEITPDYRGSYTGEAVASSRVLNIPKYLKESITGKLYYEYEATRSYLSYEPIRIATVNTYRLESFRSDPDLGKASYSLIGDVSINSSSGAISGVLSNLTVGASKIGKTEIIGNFSVSSNSFNPDLSSVSGTLNQYKTTYNDKSYLKVAGAINILAATDLDESIFSNESNFTGADTIKISLPTRIYSDYIINSGQGDDIISAGGGGGRLFIDSGQGDDEITLLDASPVINGGAGNDTVKSSVISLDLRNYTSVENITLLGKVKNATGNSDVNVLRGNSAANVLDGQGGADILEGGAGNDTYIVYGQGETITDTAGVDLVRSYASWTLGAGLENLTLMANENIDGTGNSSKNTIIGNSGNNFLFGDAGNDVLSGGAGNDTLDGGEGADRMTGGSGDDTYMVDNKRDVVTERAGEGIDTIQTTLANYSLARLAAVENLVYTGDISATLIGNRLANTLIGSDENDTLNGGVGADTMIGGSGNDTYIIDNVNDIIIEYENEGIDFVRSSISYVLSDYVENLTLTGRAVVNGIGNNHNNMIAGNTAANSLSGEQGDDILDGGAGNDTLLGGDGDDLLIGGLGNDLLSGGDGEDKFRFDKALGKSNIDTIIDFESAIDRIELDDAVFKQFAGIAGQISEGNLVKGGNGVKALDGNDHLIFNTDTGALFYDSDGSGKGGMIQFATLTRDGDLDHTDFWIV